MEATPKIKLTEEQKKVINDLMDCENDHEDWELLIAEKNVLVHKKKNLLQNYVMPLKLHAIFPDISFKVLCEMIISPAIRRQWDHLEGFDIIEKTARNEDIIYTYVKVSKNTKFDPLFCNFGNKLEFSDYGKFSIFGIFSQ